MILSASACARRPRGRLAPSPTGNLHLGNAFACLMAWLSIRAQGGTLVLRMEDIDPDRSRPAWAEGIVRDLAWLGLDWDEGPNEDGPCGPYVQSRRLAYYEAVLAALARQELTYPCYCTRKELRQLASAPHVGDEGLPYQGICRSLDDAQRSALEQQGRRPCLRLNTEAAARLLVSTGRALQMSFTDAVQGLRRFTTLDYGGDFALRRSDGVVAYQLAVVADDAAMGVTEVVRGDDLAASTPRQILLFQLLQVLHRAIGLPPEITIPTYAHVPLVYDSSGERLAKRHKGLELSVLRKAGIPADAVIGYLAWLAGLSDASTRATPRELITEFSLNALVRRKLYIQDDAIRSFLTI